MVSHRAMRFLTDEQLNRMRDENAARLRVMEARRPSKSRHLRMVQRGLAAVNAEISRRRRE